MTPEETKSMNRIYQGRVSSVEIANQNNEFTALAADAAEARRLGEAALWEHHALFQDAVNYYIVALAALGTSPDSKLTKLGRLLENVWQVADKKGQRRMGMRDSLQRAWQLAEPPTLAEAMERFRAPLHQDGIALSTAEKAAEYLLHELGGDAAIQTGGRTYLPMFCDPSSNPTFNLSASRRGRAEAERRLQTELHRELSDPEIRDLAASITLGSVVNLQPGAESDSGDAVVLRLKGAAKTFADTISAELFDAWLANLAPAFSLPKRRGGNINVNRVDACTLFLAFPNSTTKTLFQKTFAAPKAAIAKASDAKSASEESDDISRFVVDGEDPIKLSRGTRGVVFSGFTALSIWAGDGRNLLWKEFDIAAFKEALKVYNQFQQNVEKRETKLNGLALKLLVMDGERAIEAYAGEPESALGRRLQKLWVESKGKPKMPSGESGEDATVVRFKGDARIDRLRKIVNDDLAEEYRLTDGRRTAYGLRRRTMKGWGEVKRRWQGIVKKGETYSDTKKKELKAALDEMRGGEKREQIGSHKLFEAMLADEAGWSIWREADDSMQALILKNEWAADPLEAFREYCEIREAMEEVSARPLNFTPADARYSRRLFMFTDACSFGSDRGEYRHDAKALAVTVPVAVRGEDGRFAVKRCRLGYSAPRLLRDGIRGEDGGYAQDWLQPMTQALFGKTEGTANPQQLKDAAVQLMPDFDSKGRQRVLLNFPLSLDDMRMKALLKKAETWEKQFVSWKKGAQLPFVRWTTDFDGKEPHRWWERVSTFRVLAADLGTRHAASIALLECGKESGGTARFIGNAGGEDWFARYCSGAILRLPGENAKVLRPESSLDKDNLGKAFREELYGERGRPADIEECEATCDALRALNQHEMLADLGEADAMPERFSFPELNDKLLVAIRRAQGWIAACISWHWKLTQPESDEQRNAALEQIREEKRKVEWNVLADGSAENLVALRDALHVEIATQRERVQEQLLLLTHRIMPLRGRAWEWVEHPEKADCHLLRQTAEGTGPETAKLRGQRGLSMARIEQLSESRRRWQSLNQSLRREIGQKPLTASEMRNDPIPDPCPDVLVKLENIREQRVNQTAHLILAQALGLKLCTPEKSKASRMATDTHGEYEVARPPVDFIVLEDLSRYLSEQGRAKSENTRLMKWCHRAIMLKVKMLAEPFGIPVLETPAAYSSRFCSLTGMAGFRATEVGWNDRDDYRWRELRNVDLPALEKEIEAAGQNKAKLETLNRRRAEVTNAKEMFAALEKLQPTQTLLAPQPGGAMFVTARETPHPAPSPKRKHGGSVLPMQADLNAAANLALRAVAHPDCADIHHRLRTTRKKESVLARETRRFGKEEMKIILRAGDSLPKEKNTNFFWDAKCVAQFGRARLESEGETEHPYASGPGLWKAVNERSTQWSRCAEINRARLQKWVRGDDDIPM